MLGQLGQQIHRHAVGTGNVLDGPLELLDQLRVGRGHHHLLPLETIAQHGGPAEVARRVVRLEVTLQPLRRDVADLARCRQDAAGPRHVGEQGGEFIWMRPPMEADMAAANRGEVPTSGCHRQLIRSWMMNRAGM
jgi:hypothetical protein